MKNQNASLSLWATLVFPQRIFCDSAQQSSLHPEPRQYWDYIFVDISKNKRVVDWSERSSHAFCLHKLFCIGRLFRGVRLAANCTRSNKTVARGRRGVSVSSPWPYQVTRNALFILELFWPVRSYTLLEWFSLFPDCTNAWGIRSLHYRFRSLSVFIFLNS